MNIIHFGSLVLFIIVTINAVQCANIEKRSHNNETPTTEAVSASAKSEIARKSWQMLNANNDKADSGNHKEENEAVDTKAATTEDESSLRVIPLSNQLDGLLVGENTPVWIAHRPDSEKPVNYTRLENGIIKEAIDYWHSQRSSGIAFKTKRSIDDYANFDEAIEQFREAEIVKVKRSTSKVVEVSFLVVMDYKTCDGWPCIPFDERRQKKFIKEKILYALAFWNAFNLNLRNGNSSNLQLRIAGFVIGWNKEAVPYLRESESEAGLDVIDVRRKMNAYWRSIATNNADFPLDSYHCLATMTDSNPAPYGDIPNKHWDLSWEAGDVANGKVMLGFTFYDNLLFRSVPTPESIKARKLRIAIKFSGENVALQSYPHLAPGKQITTLILPGEIMPDVKQCEAHGWGVNAKICLPHADDQPCQHLRCASNNVPDECVDVGRHLIGTQCSTYGKICLDGQCVDKPKLYL